ncbi:hypothetical protein [Rhizobium mongolense]|uniref:hypothetical protein n=1 Tax=Rhizobium mongolense TaxID=57676 RepID=UPI001113DF17|nr:hypothetical protein [Rhizobium mongolense]
MGDAKIGQIGVSTAEKTYEEFGGTRMGEKVVTYCKVIWKHEASSPGTVSAGYAEPMGRRHA